MKRTICSLLVGYGGLVAVLSLLTQQFASDFARPTLLAGMTGGVLSALWGLLGLFGKPHRGWAIFTMAATGFVLLSQSVTHWMPSGEPKPGTHMLALLATVMLIVTFGTLMVVAHSGVQKPAAGGSSGGGNAGNPRGSDKPEVWKEVRRE